MRRYKTLMDDAIIHDPQGLSLAKLLSADAGRIFLFLDAAVGDVI